jgi:hypothetical protein
MLTASLVKRYLPDATECSSISAVEKKVGAEKPNPARAKVVRGRSATGTSL